MDKNKESTAYKRITEILDFSCDLTPYECYYLRGRLSAYAEKIMDAEAIEALKKDNSIGNQPSKIHTCSA